MSNSKHLIVTLISAAAVIGIASVALSTKRQSYEVEDFTDQNQNSVKTWLKSNSIPSDMVIYTHGYSDSVGKGKIISQSITPGKKLSSPDYMILRISDGKNPDSKTLVPDFTGKKLDEIKKWFDDNGFDKVSYETQERDDLDEGSFLVVTPKSGSEVTTDTKITVVTSVKPAAQPEEVETGDDQKEQNSVTDNTETTNENTTTVTPEQNETVTPVTPSESKTSGNTKSSTRNTGKNEPTVTPKTNKSDTTEPEKKPSNPAPVTPPSRSEGRTDDDPKGQNDGKSSETTPETNGESENSGGTQETTDNTSSGETE